MSTFYDHYRSLYELLFGDHVLLAKALDPDGRGAALERARDELRGFLSRLEADRAKASAAGRSTAALTREIKRAIFLKGSIVDLLIAFDDGRASITASKAAIDAAADKLKTVAERDAGAAEDLGNVSAALDAVARFLKLID